MTGYIECFNNKDFAFILNINSSEQNSTIKERRDSYNAAKQQLDLVIGKYKADQISKTETIIAINVFFEQTRKILIALHKEATKQRIILEYNKVKNEEQINNLMEIEEHSRQLLNEGHNFKEWAESIICKASFEGTYSDVSRKAAEIDQHTTDGIDDSDESLQHSEAKDLEYFVNKKPLPVSRRFEREHVDPYHRTWGTTIGVAAEALRSFYEKWIAEGRTEDLTVAVAFADAETKTKLDVFNKYYTETEALAHLAVSNSGQLFLNGRNNPLNTPDPDNFEGDAYIFVMDVHGNLFVHQDGVKIDGKRVGHPSFVSGEAVACAGTIVVKDGKITNISNSSGHYQPKKYTLYRAVAELNNRGLLSEECKVDFGQRPISFAAFESKMREAEPTVQATASTSTLELSEKQSPSALLDNLSNINQYLKTRATNTSSLLTQLFDSYTGQDYYARRQHFNSVLKKLAVGDIHGAIQLTDAEQLQAFKGGMFRKNYATLLTGLNETLKSYQKNNQKDTLTSNVVKQRAGDYSALYDQMDKLTAAAKEATKKSFFRQVPIEKLAEFEAGKIDYKYEMKAMKNRDNIENEFLNDDALQEAELKNASNLGSKNSTPSS